MGSRWWKDLISAGGDSWEYHCWIKGEALAVRAEGSWLGGKKRLRLRVHDRDFTPLQGFESIDDHRLNLSLDLDWRQFAQAHVTQMSTVVITFLFPEQIPQARGRLLTDDKGTPKLPCQLLDAGREVHMVPDHRIVHFLAFSTDIPHHNLAGMDPDPSLEGNPPPGLPLLLQLG